MSNLAVRIEYKNDLKHGPSQSTYSDAHSSRQFISEIDIDASPNVRTNGIVCTIGPSCQSVEKLQELMNNGLNICRLNFSHGSYDYHQQTIDNIRTAAESQYPHTVAIALDTKGPEIRTGIMKDGQNIEYQKGQELKVSCDPELREQCDIDNQYLEYPGLVKSVHVGSDIVIADGNLLLKVTAIIDDKTIMTTVLNTAAIGDRKNCNLPGAVIDLPAVSEKDKKDIAFAVQNKLDMVFASFIRKPKDVMDVRMALGENGQYMKVISKIENHEGIKNIDEILKVTDGVMVARGDMGMEIPLQKVFLAQKTIIARCNWLGIPVICATQMLESMIKNPRPTRAEITDVGNAVVDGADCVMLSGETASGAYPAEAVAIMHKICRDAGSCCFRRRRYDEAKNVSLMTDVSEATSIAAVGACFKMSASAIIVFSTTGSTAWYLSRYQAPCPIILVTRNAHTSRVAHLYNNVFPLEYTEGRKDTWTEDIDARLDFAIRKGGDMGFIREGSFVVFVCGYQPGKSATNSMRILKIQEDEIVGGKFQNIKF